MDYEKKFWELGNNQLAKELLGVDRFHRAGYKGQGISVANFESCNWKHEIYDGKVLDLIGNCNINDLSKNHHGDKTNIVLRFVAPESTHYLLSFAGNSSNDDFLNYSYGIIKDKNITVGTFSNSVLDMGREKEWEDLFENCYFKQTVCTGNSRWNGVHRVKPRKAYGISASHITSKGKIFTADYAAKSKDHLAYNSYCPLYTPSISKNNKTGYHYEEGTSFSTPFFAGMLALVDCFFLKNAGRPLHHKEMEKFILDNAVPTDVMYGEQNYIFVLPEPTKIKIKDYLFVEVDSPVEEKPSIPVEGDDKMEFKDVEQGKWYTKAIDYVSDKGLMKGYEDGTFKPNSTITRAEMAQILYNLRNK